MIEDILAYSNAFLHHTIENDLPIDENRPSSFAFLFRKIEGDLPMSVPTAGWFFDYALPLIWLGILVWCITNLVKRRHWSDAALGFIAASTAFWVEWFADWGAYLMYNPRLLLMPWESQWYMTPYKPWAVIAGYGVFFVLSLPFSQWCVARLQNAYPKMQRATVVLLCSAPAFYLFDIVVESLMVSMGWYSYLLVVPPALHFEKGSFSLVYPSLPFAAWAYCWVWLTDRPQAGEPCRIERWSAVTTIRHTGLQGTARLLVWILAFNITLALNQGLGNPLLRIFFGPPHALIP